MGEEEVATAKKQQAKDWVDAIKEPATWMTRLERMDYRGTTLEEGRALLQQWTSWLPEFRVPDSPTFYAVLAPRFASDYAGASLVGSY